MKNQKAGKQTSKKFQWVDNTSNEWLPIFYKDIFLFSWFIGLKLFELLFFWLMIEVVCLNQGNLSLNNNRVMLDELPVFLSGRVLLFISSNGYYGKLRVLSILPGWKVTNPPASKIFQKPLFIWQMMNIIAFTVERYLKRYLRNWNVFSPTAINCINQLWSTRKKFLQVMSLN